MPSRRLGALGVQSFQVTSLSCGRRRRVDAISHRRRRDALSRAGAASSIDDDRPQDVVPVASLQTWTVSGSSSSPATLKALDSAPDMSSADVARHVEALLEGCSLDVVATPPKLRDFGVATLDDMGPVCGKYTRHAIAEAQAASQPRS